MEVKVAAWEKSLDRHYVPQQQFDNACAILHSCITGDKLLSPEHTCHVRALIEAAMEEDNAVMIQPCESAFLYDLSFCGQFEDNILDRSIEALIELLWTRVVFERARGELVMTIVELISGRLMTPARLDAMHQHMAILSAATLVESFAEDVKGHTRRLTPVLLLQAILRVPHCPASMTTIRSLVDKLTQLMAQYDHHIHKIIVCLEDAAHGRESDVSFGESIVFDDLLINVLNTETDDERSFPHLVVTEKRQMVYSMDMSEICVRSLVPRRFRGDVGYMWCRREAFNGPLLKYCGKFFEIEGT
ncbi:hypothetical protein Slin15195_G073310 [Septoria linicola]|uniref:Uncharacterized protein n=1 Tax=Septoria linicola TaxID=215465 RepID=A0A9Q9AY22_9PEZI|nr:hypothetical protein Slin15195_G073310 [Septoria linicola]